MSTFACERQSWSIVLRGSFNPAIINPSWLGRFDLIPEQYEKTATIQLIYPQAASFTAGPFEFQVTEERFQVHTVAADAYLPMRDLVLGIFRILAHTPLRQMGLNRQMHFTVPSEEQWHSFGHTLAPKQYWKDILEDPRTFSVEIQGTRKELQASRTLVTVQPSTKVSPGLYFHVNHHYDPTPITDADKESTKAALQRLVTDWEMAQRIAGDIPHDLWKSTIGVSS